MKYKTDDGEEFDRLEDAKSHERFMALENKVAGEVDHYHSMKSHVMTDRMRAHDRRVILEYMKHEVRQRPWRYEGEPQETEAVVKAVS